MIPVHALTQRTLVAVAHRYPTIHVDQAEAFADIGLLTPLQASASLARAGQVAALAGVARRAQDGELLGRIEAPGASLAGLARASGQDPWPQLTVVAAPSHPPRIEVEPGEWRWDLNPPLGVWLDIRV